MNKQLQPRESDGRFALTLSTAAACQRAMREDERREARRLQVIAENAEWAAKHGIDESELHMLFA